MPCFVRGSSGAPVSIASACSTRRSGRPSGTRPTWRSAFARRGGRSRRAATSVSAPTFISGSTTIGTPSQAYRDRVLTNGRLFHAALGRGDRNARMRARGAPGAGRRRRRAGLATLRQMHCDSPRSGPRRTHEPNGQGYHRGGVQLRCSSAPRWSPGCGWCRSRCDTSGRVATACGSRRESGSPTRAWRSSVSSSRCRGSIADADGRRDRGRIRELVSTAVAAAVLSTLIYGVLAIGLWLFLPSMLHLDEVERRAVLGPLLVVAIAGCVAQPLRVFGAVLAGLQDVQIQRPGEPDQLAARIHHHRRLAAAIRTLCARRCGGGAGVRERHVEPAAGGDQNSRSASWVATAPLAEYSTTLRRRGRHLDWWLGVADDRRQRRPRPRRTWTADPGCGAGVHEQARAVARAVLLDSLRQRARRPRAAGGRGAGTAATRRDRRHGPRLSRARRRRRVCGARRQSGVRPSVGRTGPVRRRRGEYA